MNILKWVCLNYFDKYITLPIPNILFCKQKIAYNQNIDTMFNNMYSRRNFEKYLISNLIEYKLNQIVMKNNYFFYLLNTPDNIIILDIQQINTFFYAIIS